MISFKCLKKEKEIKNNNNNNNKIDIEKLKMFL